MKIGRSKGKFYNFILSLVLLVLLFTALIGFENGIGQTIALEQSARCGQEEHVHAEECYLDEVLICQKKAHTHSESCYLLLLEDNDINQLLTEIDTTEDKSLETVLNRAMESAAEKTSDVSKTQITMLKLTEKEIDILNDLISKEEGESSIVLNKKLVTVETIKDLNEKASRDEVNDKKDTVVEEKKETVVDNSKTEEKTEEKKEDEKNEIKEDISVSVDVEMETEDITPVADDEIAYIYVLLDDELTQVGTVELTTSSVGWNYYLSSTKVFELLNSKGYSTKNNNDYNIRYATRVPTTSDDFSFSVNYSGSVGRNSVVYAMLATRRTGDPLTYYTVTLDYPDGVTDESEIVLSGEASTLSMSNEYEWFTDAQYTNAADQATALSNIRSKTTLYARPKAYIVRYFVNDEQDGESIRVLWQNGQGATITLKNPPEGYVWLDKQGNIVSGEQTITGDTDYYASEYHTITYNKLDGTCVTQIVPVTKNPWKLLESTSTHAWVDKDNSIYIDEANIAEDIELWERAVHEVKYINIDNSQYGETKFVLPETEITLETPPDKCVWVDASGNEVIGNQVISQNTEYRAVETYTVTYFDGNKVQMGERETILSTKNLLELPLPPADYVWVDVDGNLLQGTIEILGDTSIYAMPATCRITYLKENGETIEELEVPYGTEITLLTFDADSSWISGTNTYNPGDKILVKGDMEFTVVSKVQAIYQFADGRIEKSDLLEIGQTVRLPNVSSSGNVWVDSDTGTVYQAGDIVTLTTSKNFSEKTTLTIRYDVDFPTSTELSGEGFKLSEDEPVLIGDTSVIVVEGKETVLQNVSDQNVKLYLSSATSRYGTAHFLGWETEDGTLLSPGAKLSQNMIAAHDVNNDGEVTLTGKWQYRCQNSVNFFIKYNIGDGTGNEATNYTPVVFNTYIEGATPNQFKIGDTSSNPTYNATSYYNYDQTIRKLYGESATEVRLAELPDDEEMLAYLRKMNLGNKSLYAVESTTGRTVQVEDIDTLVADNYTIRWYMLNWASEGSKYTWHIDGILVKKQGTIKVDKEFYGGQDVAEAAADGFYIVAENGTLNANEEFVPYNSGNPEFKQHILLLDSSAQAQVAAKYPNATVLLYDENKSDVNNYNFEWLIEGVSLGEYWRITEHANAVSVNGVQHIFYAEYSVYDTNGEVSALAEYGTVASVIGKTFALDEKLDQGMVVDFRNYYYPSDSLFLKKEDGKTGLSIGGAEFEIWQKNSEGEFARLRFSVDENTGQYKFDDTGTITSINTATDGFTSIAIEEFSFDHGEVMIKEVTAPDGYDKAPYIILDKDENGVFISKVYYENETSQVESYGKYAKLEDDGKVLVVRDYSEGNTSVTVTKNWENDNYKTDNVTVLLHANGKSAASTFPGMENIQVVLSDENNWSYTWDELPVYANGKEVTWSVKEVLVGKDALLSDGSSFANWIATHTLVAKTDNDKDGIIDNWNYQIENAVRRPVLMLTKKSQNGNLLKGATFTLEQVEKKNGKWQVVNGTVTDTQTTNEKGRLSFDNLVAGAYYRLTETYVPPGYISMMDSIIITVNGNGVVHQVEEDTTLTELTNDYIKYTSAYNIEVINMSAEPLPETGGGEQFPYMQGGVLLLLVAAALLIYKKKYMGERQYETNETNFSRTFSNGNDAQYGDERKCSGSYNRYN